MDYVRSLGIPVPRVLAWCADASSTPVQSEYIVMERASGIELGRVWDQLSSDQRDGVVRKLVTIKKLMMNPFFKPTGVSFTAVTLTLLLHTIGLRRKMQNDIKAVSLRERSWIQNYSIANPNPGPFDPPLHIQNQQSHLSLLDLYDAVLPYLVPQDPLLIRPTLWHRDLHFGNIFLSESDLDKGDITISAIIDWQHSCVVPLYLQARVPRFIRYHTPSALPARPDKFPLPDNLDQLDGFERQAALNLAIAINCTRPSLQRGIQSTVVHCRTGCASSLCLQLDFRVAHGREGVQEDGWVSHEDYMESLKRNEKLKEDYRRLTLPGKERDDFLRAWPHRPSKVIVTIREYEALKI
ncbi:hypothetical protein GYMLUDRAFT_980222 [Collybiopsis luxurians FD-317 M1]|nr:hypothetical protein GYMLUDRAFT_980222 [Collybiopsis luxurians FD-317 M1]